MNWIPAFAGMTKTEPKGLFTNPSILETENHHLLPFEFPLSFKSHLGDLCAPGGELILF